MKLFVVCLAGVLAWLAVAALSGCSTKNPQQPLAASGTSALPASTIPAPTLALPTKEGTLENFVEFAPGLFRGRQPDRAGLKRLAELGVKTIINLRSSNNDELDMTGLGMRYVRIPINAFFTNDGQIVAFLRVATDKDFLPAFVHCQHGSDRTGMMVAAYRICIQKWEREKAVGELSNFGFHTIYGNIRRRIERLDSTAIMEAVLKAAIPEYIVL